MTRSSLGNDRELPSLPLERGLSSALDQVGEAMAVLAAESGVILHSNSAFSRTFGQASPGSPKPELVDLFPGEEDRQLLIPAMEQARAGQAWVGHSFLKTRTGSRILFEVALSPVRNEEGTVESLVLRLRDISLEVEKDRQLRMAQKMNALGALAGGVAHDFNNLIGVMLIAAENIEAQLEPENPIRRKLEIIQQVGVRAKGLTSQILDFSRHSESPWALVDLTNLATEVATLLQTSLPGNVRLRSELAEGIRVFGDATQLHQVIMNLCINASQAMQPKGGTLSIHLRPGNTEPRGDTRSFPESCVHLTVEDTGCGMDPQTLERIFEPFFTTKETGRGTGLGLSVVNDIIKKHGGAIHVSSQPGQGSSFEVFFPVKQERRRVVNETRVGTSQQMQEGA